MKSNFGANNRGEAPGKTPATLVAFLSKHTKEDIISDGLLLRFGVEMPFLLPPCRAIMIVKTRTGSARWDVVRVPWFSQSSAGWHTLLAVG